MDETWLNLVRIARDAGDISSLFPAGIERLTDVPFTLHNAILQALGFLSFEQLPKDERPPRSIWQDPERMEGWWSDVEQAREQQRGENPTAMDTSKMDQNALTKRLLIGFDAR